MLYSPFVSEYATVLGKTAKPADVLSSSITIETLTASGTVLIKWDAIADIDFEEYVVRISSSNNWAAGSEIFRSSTTEYLYAPTSIASGTYYFLIKARDTTNNYSENAGSMSFAIGVPNTPVLTYALDGENLSLTWTDCTNQFAVTKYEVFTDAAATTKLTIAGNTLEDVGTSLALSYKVDWKVVDNPTLYIKATDTASNTSISSGTYIGILAPDTASTGGDGLNFSEYLSASSDFDNINYLMSWRVTPPGANLLPIIGYEVRKGLTNQGFSAGTTVDFCDITEKSVVVTWGPDKGQAVRRYFVAAKDSAGNFGIAAVLDVEVVIPGTPSATSVLVGDMLEVNWALPTGGSLPVTGYETREVDSGWGVDDDTKKVSTTGGFKEKVTWTVNAYPSGKPFYIRAKDSAGNYSTTESSTFIIAKPTSSLNLDSKSTFVDGSFRLSWNNANDTRNANQLPISKYRINKFEDWSGEGYSSTVNLDEANILSKDIPVTWGPSTPWRFWVVPIDSAGNVCDTSTENTQWTTTASIIVLGAPNMTYTFSGENVLVDWNTPTTGSLPVKYYETRLADSNWGVDTGDNAGTIGDATRYIDRVTWGASYTESGVLYDTATRVACRTYFVKAYDVAGNPGLTGSIDVDIASPTEVPVTDISKTVIDNNVIIKWPSVTNGSEVPVKHYEVFKCPAPGCEVGDLANVIPTVELGTASAFFETTKGTYRYWVKVRDTADNLSQGTSIEAFVNQPPDYELLDSLDFEFDSSKLIVAHCEGYNSTVESTCEANGGIWKEASFHSKSNISVLKDDIPGRAVLPVNTTETWEGHFVSQGARADDGNTVPSATPGDIYPFLLEDIDHLYFLRGDTANDAVYWQKWDLGGQVSATQLTLTNNISGIGGSITSTPTFYWTDSESLYESESITSTTGWDAGIAGASAAAATNLRFVKVKVVYSTDSVNKLGVINSQNILADLKLISESGSDSITTASTGKVITFAKEFRDMNSITVSPNTGSTPTFAVYDFLDNPNPTNFTVYLFDTSGNKTTGSFSWSAQGLDGTTGA